MADSKPRKSPQPRGLLMEIPMEHTERAMQLAAGAGLNTKADVEAALSQFVIDKYLEPFLDHLGELAVARVQKILGRKPGAAETASKPAPVLTTR